MGNLVESFCGEKGPFGQDRTARKKCATCERGDGAVYDRKMECKKGKTHVLHKLNISEILHFTRRCYDDTCKNEM